MLVESELFAAALGLQSPWYVSALEFSSANKKLDIHIDFEKGSQFPCPICGKQAKAYDSTNKSWRHLNFFEHEAHLHARVPRVNCSHGCGTKRISVPWSRPGSGFTLLFESFVLTLSREMPMAKMAELLGENDTRLWRILHHYIDDARSRMDCSNITSVGMDETASQRGHNYITLFCDMENHQILFATDGKDRTTIERFVQDLQAHKGNANNITQVSCDMSPSFISGVTEWLPEAEITFDKFHVIKILNEGVDSVRRQEVKENDVLKNTRYIWLKNEANLTEKQRAECKELSKLNLKTARAYQLRLSFQELYNQPDREAGEAYLKKWYFWATHSRLEPMMAAARTIKNHWDGILSWFDSGLTNGLLEGLNSLIQAAKSRARGYRSSRNLIAMAYLIGGKLEFNLPT